MPKFIALTPIKHDGKRVAVGGTLNLSEKEAARLLSGGDIEPAATGKSADEIAADKAAADKAAADKAAADKAAADATDNAAPKP